MPKGYIQVYTGNGKGKTTAALGLALRAVGSGLKVLFVQFIKKQKCGEHVALERFAEAIEVKLYGTGFLRGTKSKDGYRASAPGWLDEIKEMTLSGRYDLVILDEVLVALSYQLFTVEEILDLLENKPDQVEMVLTGRHAEERIIRRADLVTEMREIKHYFHQGVKARRGIEK